MADSETGDGQAAGGRRGRSQSRQRVENNAADTGAGGNSTVTLTASVEELQAQFLQIQQAPQQVLQQQATASVPLPVAAGQRGDEDAGAGPAVAANPPQKVTLAPSVAPSADASIADTDEGASRAGSDEAGDDILDIVEAVGQPDPKRKHDPTCPALAENWRELLKDGQFDQSLALRFANGCTHLIREAADALHLIETVLPGTDDPIVQAEFQRRAAGLRNGVQAAYQPLAFIQIQRTSGAAAAAAISQIATQSESQYASLGGIKLAGKLATYVTRFQEDVAKKKFKELSKSSDKSSDKQTSGGGNGKTISQESANAQSNSRADKLKVKLNKAATAAFQKCGLDADTKKKFDAAYNEACKDGPGKEDKSRGRSNAPRSLSRNSTRGAAGRG